MMAGFKMTEARLQARKALEESYNKRSRIYSLKGKINKMMAEKYGTFKAGKIKVGL